MYRAVAHDYPGNGASRLVTAYGGPVYYNKGDNNKRKVTFMKLDDIIALAKQGYKPGDIKELLSMAEENKTAEPETLPEEPAQQVEATPEGQPPVDTVEQAQTDNTAVLEDKIKDLQAQLQQAQQANLQQAAPPKVEKTAEDILADYLQSM